MRSVSLGSSCIVSCEKFSEILLYLPVVPTVAVKLKLVIVASTEDMFPCSQIKKIELVLEYQLAAQPIILTQRLMTQLTRAVT